MNFVYQKIEVLPKEKNHGTTSDSSRDLRPVSCPSTCLPIQNIETHCEGVAWNWRISIPHRDQELNISGSFQHSIFLRKIWFSCL